MSDKKFANLHYPGMKADPNEGQSILSPDMQWRFKDQIEALGLEHQKKMQQATPLLLDSSPIAIKIAKKAALLGFGSVGVLGDAPASAALEMPTKEDLSKTALQNLRDWSKRETPWARIETFKELSIDRSLDDIQKGFACFVLCSPAAITMHTTALLSLKKDVFLAFLSASKAMLGMVPKENLQEGLFERLTTKTTALADGMGTNFALLDYTAARLCILLQDYFTLGKRPQIFLDETNASLSPWKTETLSL